MFLPLRFPWRQIVEQKLPAYWAIFFAVRNARMNEIPQFLHVNDLFIEKIVDFFEPSMINSSANSLDGSHPLIESFTSTYKATF
jgi:hypothetical protein